MTDSEQTSGEPAGSQSRAQAEFARYKDRLQQAAGGTSAAFGTPVPSSAIPAWSLQPPPPPPPVSGPPGAPGAWHAGASRGAASGSVVDGVGSAIRLGIEVLNAALASGLTMLAGANDLVWQGRGVSECDCCECDACCGYDCCCVMGSGRCCEPSVGSCC